MTKKPLVGANVVFGPYNGGSFIAINTCKHTEINENTECRVGACPHLHLPLTRAWTEGPEGENMRKSQKCQKCSIPRSSLPQSIAWNRQLTAPSSEGAVFAVGASPHPTDAPREHFHSNQHVFPHHYKRKHCRGRSGLRPLQGWCFHNNDAPYS